MKTQQFILSRSNTFSTCMCRRHGDTAHWSRQGQRNVISTRTVQPRDFVTFIHVGRVCMLERPVITSVRKILTEIFVTSPLCISQEAGMI